MVVLNAKKVEYKEPVEGEDYIIVLAEDVIVESGTNSWDQIKMALEPVERAEDDSAIYSAGLWVKETYTPESKLGCFIEAHEEYYDAEGEDTNPKNTEAWVGSIFRTLSWKAKSNKVQVRGKAEEKHLEALQKDVLSRRSDE